MTTKPKQREPGLPADYKGATPEEIARALRLPRSNKKAKEREARGDQSLRQPQTASS